MAVKFGKRYRSKQNEEVLSLITVEFDNDHIVDMRTNTNIKLFNEIRNENASLIEKKFKNLKRATKHYSGSIKRGNLDGYTFDTMAANKPEIDGFLKDTYTPVDIKGYKRSSFSNAVECCIYNVGIISIKNIESV